MNKKYFLFFMFIMLFILSVYFSSAVSIEALSERRILYEPSTDKTISFRIGGADKIRSYVNGDLTQYITLDDPDQDGGGRTINIIIHFPANLTPGEYIFNVGAQEIAIREGMVGGLAMIQARIWVISLFPGKYLIGVSLSAPDINVDELANITVGATNYGTETINSMTAKIYVYDFNNNLLGTANTNSVSIESFKSGVVYGIFNAKGIQRGEYFANATIFYDGQTLNVPADGFRIGSLNMYILNTSPNMTANATNAYQIMVKSDWNGKITNAYAEVTINGQTKKTQSYDLNNFQQETMEAVFVTRNWDLGKYPVTINMFYQANNQKLNFYNYTTEVEIVKGESNLPPSQPMNFTMIAIVAALIILLAFNILYFFVFSRKKPQQEQQQPQQQQPQQTPPEKVKAPEKPK